MNRVQVLVQELANYQPPAPLDVRQSDMIVGLIAEVRKEAIREAFQFLDGSGDMYMEQSANWLNDHFGYGFENK